MKANYSERIIQTETLLDTISETAIFIPWFFIDDARFIMAWHIFMCILSELRSCVLKQGIMVIGAKPWIAPYKLTGLSTVEVKQIFFCNAANLRRLTNLFPLHWFKSAFTVNINSNQIQNKTAIKFIESQSIFQSR